jgi:hypothetical protein
VTKMSNGLCSGGGEALMVPDQIEDLNRGTAVGIFTRKIIKSRSRSILEKEFFSTRNEFTGGRLACRG